MADPRRMRTSKRRQYAAVALFVLALVLLFKNDGPAEIDVDAAAAGMLGRSGHAGMGQIASPGDAKGGEKDEDVGNEAQAVLDRSILPPEEVEELHDESNAPVVLSDALGREKFTIVVLAYKRFKSLERLLNSLLEADYGGDPIALRIRIDGGKGVAWKKSIEVASNFKWPYGSKDVIVGQKNRGLAHAWLTAWTPIADDDHCVILEDDLTVSPLYYKWLMLMWRTYGDRYEISGVTLQRQHIKATTGRRGEIINDNLPFAYKLLGSWGFSPSPRHWREFLKIDFSHLNPDVPGLITSKWFRWKKKGSIWTQYWIWYCEQHKLYTIYWNAKDKKAMGTNWREKGEHFGHTMGPDAPVVEKSDWLPMHDNPEKVLNTYTWDTSPDGHSYPPGEAPEGVVQQFYPGMGAGAGAAAGAGAGAGDDSGSLSSSSEDQEAAEAAAEEAEALKINIKDIKHDFSGLVLKAREVGQGKRFYLQLLNGGFLEMTRSWICNVKDMPRVLERTLFVCTDQAAYDGLSEFAASTGLKLNLHLQAYKSPAVLRYGQITYYLFMLFRASMLHTLLENEVGLLLTEADATWFRDVDSYLENSIEPSVDMVTLNDDLRKKNSLNGGFLWLRPTPTTRKVVGELYETLRDRLAGLAGKSYVGQAGNEQFMFEAIIRRLRDDPKEKSVNIVYLNTELFAPGQWYRSKYKSHGIAPYVVLNNWVRGQAGKIRRAKQWGQWFLADDQQSCLTRDLPATFDAADLAVDSLRDWSGLVAEATKSGFTKQVVHLVDARMLDAVRNWLCSVRGLDNVAAQTLLVCTDSTACEGLAAFLKSSGLPTALFQDPSPVPADPAYYKLAITHKLLQKGLSVLFMKAGSTWEENALQYLGQKSDDADVVTSRNEAANLRLINPNFAYFKHTVDSRKVVGRAVVALQKTLLSFKKGITEQEALELAIRDTDMDPTSDPVTVHHIKLPLSSPDAVFKRAGDQPPFALWSRMGGERGAKPLGLWHLADSKLTCL